MTRQIIEELRLKIVRLLAKYDCLVDCTIYANNTRWIYGYTFSDDYSEMTTTTKIEENVDVSEYLEYCNPDTISIAFDGSPLYEVMNHHNTSVENPEKLIAEFNALCKEYGLYFDLGNSWNLSLYEI